MNKSFFFLKKIFFPIFCFLERFYRLSFWVVIRYKRACLKSSVFPFKIISVGNLTVGGTGKSVVTPFLVRLLGERKSAICLRGYKGAVGRLGHSLLVGDGRQVFVEVKVCGDEAMMYACRLQVPVVVGKNRMQSCQLLEMFSIQNNHRVEYVVFDDAYQNFQVKKDCEILLLDARFPFDNGHCLPAGRLRERDYSRADIIILTHADQVNKDQCDYIKNNLLEDFPQDRIFSGAHALGGVFHLNGRQKDAGFFKGKRFLAAAGVGSFQGLIHTFKKAGIGIADMCEYSNHHAYKKSDINHMLMRVRQKKLDGVVTTAKDWVKISPFLQYYENWQNLPIFVVRVSFEFLLREEYDDFIKVFQGVLDKR